MSEKLKPCPFCGSRGVGFERNDSRDDVSYGCEWVACSECQGCSVAMIPIKDPVEKQLTELWNRRDYTAAVALRVAQAVYDANGLTPEMLPEIVRRVMEEE